MLLLKNYFKLEFPIRIPLRKCTHLFSYCAKWWGNCTDRNCAQIKSTCVGNPSLNWIVIVYIVYSYLMTSCCSSAVDCCCSAIRLELADTGVRPVCNPSTLLNKFKINKNIFISLEVKTFGSWFLGSSNYLHLLSSAGLS